MSETVEGSDDTSEIMDMVSNSGKLAIFFVSVRNIVCFLRDGRRS